MYYNNHMEQIPINKEVIGEWGKKSSYPVKIITGMRL